MTIPSGWYVVRSSVNLYLFTKDTPPYQQADFHHCWQKSAFVLHFVPENSVLLMNFPFAAS